MSVRSIIQGIVREQLINEDEVNLQGKTYELRKVDNNTYVFGVDDSTYTCTIKTKNGIPESEKDIKCTCPGFKFKGFCKHAGYLLDKLMKTEKKRFSADSVEEIIKDINKTILQGLDYTIAGSYRRGRKDQKDLDILVLGDHYSSILQRLRRAYPGGDQLRPGDKVRPGGVLGGGTRIILRWYIPIGTSNDAIELDFMFIKDKSDYEPTLLYRTGPMEFNVKMRSRAKKMGFKLNEHGLFDLASGQRIAVTEKDIFSRLNMPYVPPNQRT